MTVTKAWPPMTANVRDLQTITDLERVSSGWDRLTSSLPGPGQQSIWMRAAAATFANSTFHAVALGDRDLRAVAPLVRHRGQYELATVTELGEPMDFLWRDEESLAELCDVFARARAPLVLGRTLASSPTLVALRRAYGHSALQVTHVRPALPYIRLDDSWLEPESHFDTRRRSDIRRARRHADAAGEVTFEFLSPAPTRVKALLDEALAVEAQSWKSREGTALVQDSLRLPFYRLHAATAAESGSLRVSFLRIDGRPAAMQLGIESGSSLWLLKIGYDEEFHRTSPGELLMLEAIRHAAKLRLRTVELLGAAGPWSRRWTRDERASVRTAFFPLHARSLVPYAEDGLREVVHTLAHARA
jgi:CelD/BcsL family acetyltransferase involved in cellulose biosynthesis